MIRSWPLPCSAGAWMPTGQLGAVMLIRIMVSAPAAASLAAATPNFAGGPSNGDGGRYVPHRAAVSDPGTRRRP